jgi:hypothetical protein
LPGGCRGGEGFWASCGRIFAVHGREGGDEVVHVWEFSLVFCFAVLLSEEIGGGLGWQERGLGGSFEFGLLIGIAAIALVRESGCFVHFFDASRVVGAAEGAAGIVALFLQKSDFVSEAGEEVHHLREGGEVEVLGAGGFLEEDLGDAGGGGLEADFGEFGGIIAAQMSDEMVLVEAVLEDEFLFELPFGIAAPGDPRGDVALGEGETAFINGADDVFVRDAVGEHAADQVAVDLGQGSDPASAAGFVGRDRRSREGLSLDDNGRLSRCDGLKAEVGFFCEVG